MSLTFRLKIWLLTKLVALPVVGRYFEQTEYHVQEYVEKTNYQDEFKEMIELLRDINDTAKKAA